MRKGEKLFKMLWNDANKKYHNPYRTGIVHTANLLEIMMNHLEQMPDDEFDKIINNDG